MSEENQQWSMRHRTRSSAARPSQLLSWGEGKSGVGTQCYDISAVRSRNSFLSLPNQHPDRAQKILGTWKWLRTINVAPGCGCTPLIPALGGRGRRVLWFPGQPGLLNEFPAVKPSSETMCGKEERGEQTLPLQGNDSAMNPHQWV